MKNYFTPEGLPMDMMEWATAFFGERSTVDGRTVIGKDSINGIDVSTVWLGMNHSSSGGLAIFESMTFGSGEWGECQWRYATKKNAAKGHAIICEAIRGGKTPNEINASMELITSY